MDEQQRDEHNQIYQRAVALLENEIPTHERMNMPAPGWWTRRKLNRARALLKQVVTLNPENWPAMWLLGKAGQRLKETEEALSWFERSYQINPSQPDVAREAAICAMDAGKNDVAVVFSFRAVQIEPTNAGLHANLALAYLLADRMQEARASVERSLEIDPKDAISRTIGLIVDHFKSNGRKPPTTTPALMSYWQKNGRNSG